MEGISSYSAPTLPGIVDPNSGAEGSPPTEFYRCLPQERAAPGHAERVRVRRRMKALCPLLFESYLAQWKAG